MTRYLERALSGITASAEEWNEHLTAFHDAYPSVTSQCFRAFVTSNGLTSYEVLARAVHAAQPRAQTILDVGCGGGELLDAVARVYGRPLRLYGIDLSDAELTRARERLPDATFVHADASRAFPAGPFDVVLAHLSLLSMSRLGDVLRNVRSSLAERGLLAFMMEDVTSKNDIVESGAAAFAALRRRYPQSAIAVPEREPFETEASLRALLTSSGFSPDARCETVVLRARLLPSEAVDFTLLAYPFALLEKHVQQELRDAVHDAVVRRCEPDGRVEITFPLKLVIARSGEPVSPPPEPPPHQRSDNP